MHAGIPADLVNAGIYTVQGDYVNAGASAAAITPLGDLAKFGVYGARLIPGFKVSRKEEEKLDFGDNVTGEAKATWEKTVDPDNVTVNFGASEILKDAAVKEMGATNRTQLIDDLVTGGTRITPENVVDIRSINGRTVWLETGNSSAGLQHIVGKHGPEFAQRGIMEAQIPDVIFTALQKNNVVGYQGRGTGRPIYEFDYGGLTHQLAITVGDNGFIVGANFR